MRKPFYWKARQCWYVKQDGKNIRLDPDETKAFTLWEEFRKLANFRDPNATVEAILEAFAEKLEAEVKDPKRYEGLIGILSRFAESVGPATLARTIEGRHLLKFLKSYNSAARKRDVGSTVKRAFRWAMDSGILPRTDILSVKFEKAKSRESMVSRADHERLVKSCLGRTKKARPFALVLVALWHTGARPIAIRQLTAANVMPTGDWVFREHKTRGSTGMPLVIHPGPCAQTLVRILTRFRPKGPLFRTSLGEAWSKNALVLRFRREREELGIDNDVTLYSYRHGWTTDALVNGMDLVTAAALLGHTSTKMVSEVYGHLSKHRDILRERAARARHPKQNES